jgi:hypothetical protein
MTSAHRATVPPSLGQAALRYAARDWFVFPLRPRSKDPLTPHGFKDASRNPEHVRRWWAATPDANLGLWPGPSGLVVVDSDGPVGEATLAARGLTTEPTLTVVTGRAGGGRHLYFMAPSFDLKPVTLGPGTTIRHMRGYVAVPPSVHPTTGAVYRWAGRIEDLRPLPAALLDALREPPPAPAPPRHLLLLPPDLSSCDRRVAAYLRAVGAQAEGTRNAVAFTVAAWLQRDMALPTRDAWQWLLVWNEKNVPPLAERELAAVFRSAAKHGRRPIGAGRAVSR